MENFFRFGGAGGERGDFITQASKYPANEDWTDGKR